MMKCLNKNDPVELKAMKIDDEILDRIGLKTIIS